MLQLGENCIWCKSSTDESDLSYVVPMSLGNTEQVLLKGVVCRSCNNFFGRRIEPALLKDPVIQTMCAMYHVVNSRTGKVIQPRLFGRHAVPIDIPRLTPQLHLAVSHSLLSGSGFAMANHRQEYGPWRVWWQLPLNLNGNCEVIILTSISYWYFSSSQTCLSYRRLLHTIRSRNTLGSGAAWTQSEFG